MMESSAIIKTVQLLLALSLLVIIHELGHFMFAKLFKCRVEKFYLFFDYKYSLFKKKIGETEFGIGWIPIGGYVKISGMVDESMDTEQLKQEPQPWEYRAKPAWQRFFIIIGGVMMNILLAMVIFIGITYAWGDNYIKNSDVHNGYAFSEVAKEMGFKNGDKIISIDGEEIESYSLIPQMILLGDNRIVNINRNGEEIKLTITDAMIQTMLKDKGFINLRIPFNIAGIQEGSIAESAGLIKGDSLVAVNGVNMVYLDEFSAAFVANRNQTVQLGVIRKGVDTVMTVATTLDSTAMLGVMPGANIGELYTISYKDYTLAEAIPAGIVRGYDEIGKYLQQLKVIVNPDTGAYKEVGGFIAMGSIFPGEWSWFAFWHITALLSIMLAVINILPIPALDGGHLVFIVYEMIARRPPSQKVLEVAQYIGFFIIMGVVILANGNDIIKFFS